VADSQHRQFLETLNTYYEIAAGGKKEIVAGFTALEHLS
jgi:hypothetical protein